MKQAHTEPGLQPADCVAQRRRGDAAGGFGAPETTMPDDVQKSVKIGKIGTTAHQESLKLLSTDHFSVDLR